MAELIGRQREIKVLAGVVTDTGPRAVVEVGRAGVGKSRLLDEFATIALDSGQWHVERIYALPGLRSVTFGALSHLLPMDAPPEPHQLLPLLRARLLGRAGGRALLVLVDDAHHLDEGTAALLHQLVAHGDARGVVALRTSEPAPAALTSLWKDGHAEQLRVEPLNAEQTAHLAAAVLDGPVSDDLAAKVWDLTRGHPLYAVVALQDGTRTGALERREGRWHALGQLTTMRLRQLVAARLDELSEHAARTFALVAVTSPLPEHALAPTGSDRALAELRDRGLVSSDARPDATLDITHPLFAEAALARLGPRTKADLALDVMVTVRRAQDGLGDLCLRAGLWALDAGVPVDADVALAAARQAMSRGDHENAERLARVAVAAGSAPGVPGAVLVRSLAAQGRGEQALAESGVIDASTPEERAELALAQGFVLAFALGRPREGASVLQRAAEQAEAPFRWRLELELSLYAAISGDFARTIEAATAALRHPEAPPAACAMAYANLTLAQAMMGRLRGFHDHVQQGLELARHDPAAAPLAASQMELNWASERIVSGHLSEADRMCARRTGRRGDAQPSALEWLTLHGMLLGLRGRLSDAIEMQGRALERSLVSDAYRTRPQSVGLWLMHHSQAGLRVDDAESLAAEAELEAQGDTRLAVWVGRALVWMRADAEERDAAALAAEVGRAAIEHDHVFWGVLALHDAVRLGHAGIVLDSLGSAAASSEEAPLLDSLLHHARAAAADDANQLERISRRLAGHGCDLYAAEAAAQAARIHEDAGNRTAAARATTIADVQLQQCQSVQTPPIVGRPAGLTGRELEIAVAAAAGDSSRAIADDLFLSTRTVDNHLHATYSKLDLAGRKELTTFLRSALPPPE